MDKHKDPERYKSFDVMLPQGARSRFEKAASSIEEADALLPENALGGTAADLQAALVHLNRAQANLCELIVYRKLMGVD
jgi:hypothetical protein